MEEAPPSDPHAFDDEPTAEEMANYGIGVNRSPTITAENIDTHPTVRLLSKHCANNVAPRLKITEKSSVRFGRKPAMEWRYPFRSIRLGIGIVTDHTKNGHENVIR